MRKALTLAYYWLALLIAIGIVVQVFLAGLGIFGAESFDAHEEFGGIVHGLTILVFLLAIAGPRTARTIGMGFGLAVLVTIAGGRARRRARRRGLSPRAGALRPRARLPHRDAGAQPRTGSVRSSSSAVSASCISAVTAS